MKRELQKEQQGGRWERREGGKDGGREGGREVRRGMMAIIWIKMLGFGQSQIRPTVSMPTSCPPLGPSGGLNQANWLMQGASMAQAATYGGRGSVPKSDQPDGGLTGALMGGLTGA